MKFLPNLGRVCLYLLIEEEELHDIQSRDRGPEASEQEVPPSGRPGICTFVSLMGSCPCCVMLLL